VTCDGISPPPRLLSSLNASCPPLLAKLISLPANPTPATCVPIFYAVLHPACLLPTGCFLPSMSRFHARFTHVARLRACPTAFPAATLLPHGAPFCHVHAGVHRAYRRIPLLHAGARLPPAFPSPMQRVVRSRASRTRRLCLLTRYLHHHAIPALRLLLHLARLAFWHAPSFSTYPLPGPYHPTGVRAPSPPPLICDARRLGTATRALAAAGVWANSLPTTATRYDCRAGRLSHAYRGGDTLPAYLTPPALYYILWFTLPTSFYLHLASLAYLFATWRHTHTTTPAYNLPRALQH